MLGCVMADILAQWRFRQYYRKLNCERSWVCGEVGFLAEDTGKEKDKNQGRDASKDKDGL